MRALLVMNAPNQDQLATWREVASRVNELHVVSSNSTFGNPVYAPGTVGSAEWATSWTTVRPRGWRRRGHLYWRYPGLNELVDRVEPDVIHVLSEAWGLLVSQALTADVPVTAHGSSTRYDTGSRVEGIARKALFRRNTGRLAGFMAATGDALDEARRYGLPSRLATGVGQHLVPDPVPLHAARARRATTRAELGWDHDVVLFVGRLVPEKGLSWLLASWAKVGHLGAELVVVGDGPERSLAAAGSRVRWLGRREPDEVRELIAASDVTVVPSLVTEDWQEHFGRVALEALHAGVPLIVSDSGHLPQLVGDAAPVIAHGDVNELARAISDALEDTDRLSRSTRTGHEASERFVPARVASNVIDVWSEALGQAR